MQKSDFSDCLDALVAADPRFEKEAYLFVREALEFTLKRQEAASGSARKAQKRSGGSSSGGTGGTKDEPERHVAGQQLAAGARDLALAEWGPMAITVLAHWGIHSTADIGAIVYHLIDARIFGKNEGDSPEDFAGVFDFHEAFVAPYRPAAAARAPGDILAATKSAPPSPFAQS